MTPGQHLNQDDAESPNIAGPVHLFAENLLWSHVRERARGGAALCCGGGGDYTSEAEVHNLRGVVLGDDDIGRLDVAVHDVARVRGAKPFGHLDGQVQRLANWQHAAAELLGEGFALVVAHDDEYLVFFGFLQAMDHPDIRVIQGGSGARFAPHVFFVLVADGEFMGQEFQGDGALQL